ncbi:MAG: molybdopterin-dependent oxidoreductase [Anaerolineae bacterium]
MIGNQGLTNYPPTEKWDDWVEYDAKAWPRKVPRRYTLVPTVCFNCEAACGLLSYIDKEAFQIKKFEGNPVHPGSRGRTCAKGPATLNQINDPDRILYPLKRVGERGEGRWERVTWDGVLDDIAGRIRRAILENRRDEIMYHVGRPGEDGYTERVLAAWGVDGHNSHTNICSSGARAGYFFWGGFDRPSPDYANARVTLLVSAHLETGHYFNPHAQRIIEGKLKGAKLITLDPRLSNTASMSDYWLPTWPGSEAALVLSIANHLIQHDKYDRDFLRRWVNWKEYLHAEHPEVEPSFENFEKILKQLYAEYTPELAEQESGIPAERVVEVAEVVAGAQGRLATHVWRSAASGNLGGWQVARALWFLNVLTGSVGTEGGTAANSWNKFVPKPHTTPAHPTHWNELTWPEEYPLTFYEMSFLLPHFLKEGRGKLDVYFTRVYNPLWINPDGFTWMEVLRDESKIGLHAALTPTWNETAWFADYVLPMGHAGERHDLMSQETHAGQWIAFRQPVMRVAMERMGQKVEFTYQANPGEVWEENEFWIELSWRIDPDGELGVRQHFESPYRPGEKITVEEYYRWIFENSVPGLPEAAAGEGLTSLEYMRKYGVFTVTEENYAPYERSVEADGAEIDPETGIAYRACTEPGRSDGRAIGVEVDGVVRAGFGTPSKKLEFYSPTLREWGWPEHALPGYIKSHVHPENIDKEQGQMLLLPTYRLPNLIHTRSANAKWLYEISHKNPLWIHPSDAERLGVRNNDLVRVETDIGYFVIKCWLTEGMRPGIVACSHHLGRWRLRQATHMNPAASGVLRLDEKGDGEYELHLLEGIRPYKSSDPDTERIWWEDPGVHQNITFPVHPDPISGMHCWHQRVTVRKAGPGDRYGDICVDTKKSIDVYREWLAKARPAREVSPDGNRRPLWFKRPLHPVAEAYRLPAVVARGRSGSSGELRGTKGNSEESGVHIWPASGIQRTAHGQSTSIQDMGVDHRGFHIPSTGSGHALCPSSSWTVRIS